MESEEFPQTQPLKKILLENRQFEVISNTKEKAVFNEDPNTKIEKPNKAITPYIAFVKDYKENHGTVSFKELGSIWKEISIEEKQKYVKIAEEDLNRYKQENAKYLEAISLNPQNENEEQKDNNDDVGIAFPLSRIKNMLKCDEDNKLIKKNVLLYLEQATELFGEHILKEMTSNVREKKNKKKKLETCDLFEIIKKNKKFTFLRSTGIFEAENEKPSKIKSKEKSDKPPVENVQKMQITNNKKIEDYFKKIK